MDCAQVMVDFLLDEEFNVDTAFYRKVSCSLFDQVANLRPLTEYQYASKKHMKSSVYIRSWAVNRWPGSINGTSEYKGQELLAEIEGKL